MRCNKSGWGAEQEGFHFPKQNMVPVRIGKSQLAYAQCVSAETVAILTIGAADLYDLPVSTAQVLSSGMAWALTLPAAIRLSGSLDWLLTRLF